MSDSSRRWTGEYPGSGSGLRPRSRPTKRNTSTRTLFLLRPSTTLAHRRSKKTSSYAHTGRHVHGCPRPATSTTIRPGDHVIRDVAQTPEEVRELAQKRGVPISQHPTHTATEPGVNVGHPGGLKRQSQILHWVSVFPSPSSPGHRCSPSQE